MIYRILISSVLLLVISCSGNIQPKPKAFLRLEYPEPTYDTIKESCPFSFEKNHLSFLNLQKGCSMNLDYSQMKATIYITYKPVKDNLTKLLKDAQNFTYEHTTDDCWQPYVFGGGGILYSFADIPGMGAHWNGNYQFAGGLRYRLDDLHALLFEARYHHISNAGSADPNVPLNGIRLMIGYAF